MYAVARAARAPPEARRQGVGLDEDYPRSARGAVRVLRKQASHERELVRVQRPHEPIILQRHLVLAKLW